MLVFLNHIVPQEITTPATPSTSGVEQVTSTVPTDAPSVTRNPEEAAVGPLRKYTNTVLEVKKLPADKNNITTLNDYFQKFGKIVNIQVRRYSSRKSYLVLDLVGQNLNKDSCRVCTTVHSVHQPAVSSFICAITKLPGKNMYIVATCPSQNNILD